MKRRPIETAIDLLKESLRQNPSGLKARFDLASVYVTLGQWQDAEETVTVLVEHPKMHEGYLNLNALILLHQNRAAEALPMLDKVLANGARVLEDLDIFRRCIQRSRISRKS